MKLTPKRRTQLSHKLIVLSDLILENLDELQATNELSKEMVSGIEKLKGNCESLIDPVYKIDSIACSTYLQDLSKKVDTVIRKNLERKD